MAAKPVMKVPAERLALYEALIATIPGLARKGATMPYTSVNGNMFTFISAEGAVGIRLPEPDRGAFLRDFATTLFAAHGRIMNEYVTVPDALLERTAELKVYLELSHAFASALKSKATKRA